MRDVASNVKEVDSTLERAFFSNSLANGFVPKLRAAMETFFRGTAKFPDYIEVGLAVFFDMYDWHVKNQQQLIVTRAPDGRYWMQFMFTTLILRHEQDPGVHRAGVRQRLMLPPELQSLIDQIDAL